MGRICLTGWLAALLGMSGCTLLVESELEQRGQGQDDCEGAADGHVCGADRLCIGGECVESTCGDGIVDARRGEQCDDGNVLAGDGCEPITCTYSCQTDAECADGNPCNGAERCSEGRVCEQGAELAPGDACSTDVVQDGTCREQGGTLVCVSAGCGDGNVDDGEQCDDGNDVDGDGCDNDCTYSCEAAADCDDGLLCNGEESCDVATHTCQPGAGPSCMPTDACHRSECLEEEGGCVESQIDEDGDGHSPTSLGACGTDCDDTDPNVYPGAPEGCEVRDWNCNGTSSSGTAVWYPDCDGDTFAPAGSAPLSACPAPTPAAGCMAWTQRVPSSSATTDCDDSNANMRPNQTMFFTTAHSPALTGDSARFGNYDCNGAANYQYSMLAGADSTAACTPTVDRGVAVCSGSRGWTTSTSPACGVLANWTECPSPPTLCTNSTAIACRFHTLLCVGASTLPGDPCYCPRGVVCEPSCTPGSRGCPWGYYRCGLRTTEARRMGCR